MLPSRVSSWVPPLLGVLALASLTGSPARAADDGTWTRLPASVGAPDARREHVAIYDEPRNRYVFFGGFGFLSPSPGGLYHEIHSLSLGDTPEWTEIVAVGPGERHTPQWGYDPANQRMLVFGGYGHHYPNGPNEYLYDVWQLALDGTPAWTELFANGPHPTGRLAGASIYDPLRQRFVVFGGTVGATVDVYSLELSHEPHWVVLQAQGDPPIAGYGMTTIYDPKRDRMIMFGGSISDDYFGVHDDVWELKLSPALQWTKITPVVAGPSARRTLTSIYDPVRDRMVIFAGWDNLSNNTSSFLHDVWALSLEGEPVWTELLPAGDGPPTGRDGMTAAYDSKADRLVVYGGWSGAQMLDDTWFLTWGQVGERAVLTPTAQAQAGNAHISWDVQAETAPHGAVFRRQEGTPWQSVAVLQQDGAGNIVFDDPTVVPGGRYAYLAAVPSERGADFGGEVWVDVPSTIGVTPSPTLDFALRGAVPNPVTSRFTVSFSLPGGAPARLALRDVTGRNVIVREVGGLGAGPHQVELARGRDLAAGVYFLTLEQGERSASRRVVVVD